MQQSATRGRTVTAGTTAASTVRHTWSSKALNISARSFALTSSITPRDLRVVFNTGKVPRWSNQVQRGRTDTWRVRTILQFLHGHYPICCTSALPLSVTMACFKGTHPKQRRNWLSVFGHERRTSNLCIIYRCYSYIWNRGRRPWATDGWIRRPRSGDVDFRVYAECQGTRRPRVILYADTGNCLSNLPSTRALLHRRARRIPLCVRMLRSINLLDSGNNATVEWPR